MQDHAVTARTEAVELHPCYKLLCRLIRRTIARTLTDTQCRRNLFGLRRLQKILKVAVFREDIAERFVHYIAGGCVDESGVPIDRLGSRFIKPDRSTDVVDLVDLKQRHCCSP